jgi:hypothetical protein
MMGVDLGGEKGKKAKFNYFSVTTFRCLKGMKAQKRERKFALKGAEKRQKVSVFRAKEEK